jgi:hypothetical protein
MLSTALDFVYQRYQGGNRKSKNRQHKCQKKKDKGTNNDLQNMHIKRKIELHEPRKKSGVNSGAPEGYFDENIHGSMH